MGLLSTTTNKLLLLIKIINIILSSNMIDLRVKFKLDFFPNRFELLNIWMKPGLCSPWRLRTTRTRPNLDSISSTNSYRKWYKNYPGKSVGIETRWFADCHHYINWHSRSRKYQQRIPNELLCELAECLLDKTLYSIVKELTDIQHFTEKQMFQKRLEMINKHSCKYVIASEVYNNVYFSVISCDQLPT